MCKKITCTGNINIAGKDMTMYISSTRSMKSDNSINCPILIYYTSDIPLDYSCSVIYNKILYSDSLILYPSLFQHNPSLCNGMIMQCLPSNGTSGNKEYAISNGAANTVSLYPLLWFFLAVALTLIIGYCAIRAYVPVRSNGKDTDNNI